MFQSKSMNAAEGYTYPPPSIAGGRAVRKEQVKTSTPKLNRETINRIKRAVKKAEGEKQREV